MGGGYGGFIVVVKFIEVGFVNGFDDFCIIEVGGGYGGIWYWNCYFGLYCDVESYIYMLLLEEMGYVFK